MLADNLLIFDNLRQTIKILALVHLDPEVPLTGPIRPGAWRPSRCSIGRLRQPVPLARAPAVRRGRR